MAKARILVVDDQRYFRVLLDDLLGNEGYEVTTAEGAQQALEAIERLPFDVVLTDMVMPGMSGAELVEQFKSRWPDQDVVVVTSVGDVRTAVEAMRRGASDYLLKPLDATLLTRSLDNILQRRRLRREHASLMAENLEYLGALSLYERTMALFSTLTLEPLAERIAEGLCLEVRAQGAIVWLARPDEPGTLGLATGRGLVDVAREPESFAVSALPPPLERLAEPGVVPFTVPHGDAGGEALLVPFRHEGRLLGFARLTDRFSGARFEEHERAAADRFATPAAVAVHNALRFRGIEQSSFRDPVTKAYTSAFFMDTLAAEIRKANRFERPFSLVGLELEGVGELRRKLSEADYSAWRERLAYQLGRVLRNTDLMAAEGDARFTILLPETDSLGVAVLKRRIRELLERSDLLHGDDVVVQLAAVSYPADAHQIEDLQGALRARLEQDGQGPLHEEEVLEKSVPRLLDSLAERATGHGVGAFDALLRFVLGEVERRAGCRGLLCVAPGAGRAPLATEILARLDAATTKTEVVLLSDEDTPELAGGPVTRVRPQRIGTQRPFLVYYGEGPGYVLVSGGRDGESELYQSDDRQLVEHLAFELHRTLGVPIAR